MSETATGARANSETLDAIAGLEPGKLGEPEIVDDIDDAAIRRMTGTEEGPREVDTGARTQQGQMKADVAVAEGRAKRALAREATTDARINEKVKRFLANEADGFLQVTRLGPVEMPSIELGIVGQIRHAQLAAMTIAEVLAGMCGGGLFQIAAYRGDNSPVEGDVYTVQVVGDPKTKTKAGKAWLARANREGALDEPPVVANTEGTSSLTQLVLQMMERDKERDRLRADQEEARRRQEADERKREWEARRDEEKATREKELAELKEQRARERDEAKEQRARDLAEFNARREAESTALKARIDSQIAQMNNEAAFRLETLKADHEQERQRRQSMLDAEMRRMETRETGGLGFEGLTKIREQIAEVIAKTTLKNAGLDEDDDESPGIGGAFADVLRSEGPELLQKAASVFLPKLAAWLPGGSAEPQVPAPAQAFAPPSAPRQLPPTSPAPPSGVPDFGAATAAVTAAASPAEPDGSVDVPSVEEPAPAAAPMVPTREIAVRAATNYALSSVLQFIRPLTVLALAQPDPAEAWDVPVTDEGRTLSDLYRAMPKNAREAAATDWSKFVGAVKEASPADADLWGDAVAQDGGEAWQSEFLAAGPWVPEAEEVA